MVSIEKFRREGGENDAFASMELERAPSLPSKKRDNYPFYTMVMDILGTLQTANKQELERAKKREFVSRMS